ncbi:MAG: Rap1a/Tai family immunity protein [Stappiaceae bacterium]
MNVYKIASFALISLFIASPSDGASGMTGEQLYKYCSASEDDVVPATFCRGYLIGLVDGAGYGTSNTFHLLDLLGERRAPTNWPEAVSSFLNYCPPEDTDFEQIVVTVVNFLEKNHQDRHLSADYTVWEALRDKYPCV